MPRVRSPRYAPEMLERKLSPSGFHPLPYPPSQPWAVVSNPTPPPPVPGEPPIVYPGPLPIGPAGPAFDGQGLPTYLNWGGNDD